ncbi:MAG: ABC transporter transmembrane domain-containing protein, partial [Magnetococcus sp. DMHC-8]
MEPAGRVGGGEGKETLGIDAYSKKSSWLLGMRSLPGMAGIGPTILLASVFINILSLALPITLIQVYDRILPNESLSSLGWLVLGVVMALFLEAVLRVARTYLSGWVGLHFELEVGGGAFNRLTTTSITEFERDGLGTHLDRLNAVNTLRDFYSGSAFQVMLDVPFAILFVGAIGYLA